MDFVLKAFVYLAIGLTFAGALSCEEPAQKTLSVSADGQPTLLITAEWSGYDDAKEILSGVPSEPMGGVAAYEVDSGTYEKVRDALDIQISPEDEARWARWKENFDHWDNVNAFMVSINEISADRVIDANELARICFVLPQWKSQLTAARDYVENYREVEPDTVEMNPNLGNLQREAERALTLLGETERSGMCN